MATGAPAALTTLPVRRAGPRSRFAVSPWAAPFPAPLRRVGSRVLDDRGSDSQALESKRIRLVHDDVDFGGLSAIELGLDGAIDAAGQAADAIGAIGANGLGPNARLLPQRR